MECRSLRIFSCSGIVFKLSTLNMSAEHSIMCFLCEVYKLEHKQSHIMVQCFLVALKLADLVFVTTLLLSKWQSQVIQYLVYFRLFFFYILENSVQIWEGGGLIYQLFIQGSMCNYYSKIIMERISIMQNKLQQNTTNLSNNPSVTKKKCITAREDYQFR